MTVEELKVFVQQHIKTNYNEEITGAVLQNVILNTIDTLRAFDYSDLSNKPSINGVTLVGDKSAAQLGLVAAATLAQYYTKTEIDALLDEYYDITEMDDLLDEKEDVENKAQTLTNSTVYYPSVKCVKDVTDALNTRIDNISGVGRFLSTWNCTTGLPVTNPTTSPYLYITGDYYIVSTVGATNYIPNGDRYIINQASTVTAVEPNIPSAGDIYKYDGTNWALLKVQSSKAVWGSIEGTLSNQTDLSNALSDITTDITALESGKIGKIQNPNNGKFASINSDGTVGNSNYDSSSFATAAQGALAATAYQKPQGGIPETDLNSNVIKQLWYYINFTSPNYTDAITAYDLGKNLYTIINGELYFCTSYDNANDSLIFTSMHTDSLSMQQGVLGCAILYYNNTWDTDYAYFDTTEVKTQTINTDSTITEYPSAKAVYNYGQALINNIDNRLVKVATYGTTTYAQIRQWIEAGNVVTFEYTDGSLTKKYTALGYNDSTIMFGSIFNQICYYAQVTSSDIWWRTSFRFELTENRVNSISSTSDDSHYPSAKAVYDYTKPIKVATYGTTTYAQIESWYNAGNTVKCKYGLYERTLVSIQSNIAYFVGLYRGNAYVVYVNNNDLWREEVWGYEQTSNRETTTASFETNKANTSKYPSNFVVDSLFARKVSQISVANSVPSQELAPNTEYVFATRSSNLTLSFGSAISGIENEYNFIITIDTTTKPTISGLDNVTWVNNTAPSFSLGYYYEISIKNNIGTFIEI